MVKIRLPKKIPKLGKLGGKIGGLFGTIGEFIGTVANFLATLMASVVVKIRDTIGRVTSRLLVRSVAANAGAVIANQILNAIGYEKMLEVIGASKDDYRSPEFQNAVNYMRTISTINALTAAGVNTIATIDKDVARTYADAISAWYWSMGLGWLTWASMSPVIDYYIASPLRAYFGRKEGIGRISDSKLVDAWRRGIIDTDTLIDVLASHGYSKEAAQILMELEHKELSYSEVVRLYKAGLIDDNAAIERLKKLGYKEDDIKLLLATVRADRTQKERDLTKSEILRAYQRGLISRDDAISYLKALGYSDDEIAILLALAEYQNEKEERELSTGQVRSAYIEGILNKDEARRYLKEIGYSDRAIDVLLALWDNERAPKPRRLNLTTLKAAYLSGVLSDEEFLHKAVDLGYVEEDARLVLEVLKARKVERPRHPSLSVLQRSYIYGIITEEEYREKLKELGYPDEDVEMLVKDAQLKAWTMRRKLTKTEILRAMEKGLIDPQDAFMRLLELGYSEEDAMLLIALTAGGGGG